MNCECRARLEEKLAEHAKSSLPDGYEHYSASLRCYGFGIDDGTMTTILTLPYEGHVMVPKKAGGLKKQKISIPVSASFCPFCGTPTKKGS